MASGGAKTEILVDVETSPNVAVANVEPAVVVKSDYAAIPEGGGGGRGRLTISGIWEKSREKPWGKVA